MAAAVEVGVGWSGVEVVLGGTGRRRYDVRVATVVERRSGSIEDGKRCVLGGSGGSGRGMGNWEWGSSVGCGDVVDGVSGGCRDVLEEVCPVVVRPVRPARTFPHALTVQMKACKPPEQIRLQVGRAPKRDFVETCLGGVGQQLSDQSGCVKDPASIFGDAQLDDSTVGRIAYRPGRVSGAKQQVAGRIVVLKGQEAVSPCRVVVQGLSRKEAECVAVVVLEGDEVRGDDVRKQVHLESVSGVGVEVDGVVGK